MTLRAAFAVALPLAGAALCTVLALRYIAPGVDLNAMARGIIGPATWPKAMLLAAAAAAVLLAIARLPGLLGGRRPRAGDAQDYHEGRSIGAIALVVAYGVATPFLGIAWSTPLFFVGWMLLGGLRRPVLITLTSVLGTLGLLYFFVKLSKMPLDRGTGVFEQASVALYRLLGIY